MSDHQGSREQAHDLYRDGAEHHRSISQLFQQLLQDQCSHHGASAKTGQRQGHRTLGEAKPGQSRVRRDKRQ